MSRLLMLIKKNFLRFIRNPKTMGFIIIIPIIYYALLGFIFGGIDFTDTTTTYNIGWVDNDQSTANYEFHPNYNLDFLLNITDEIDGINVVNYPSVEEAYQASLKGIITSYVVFPDGFESYLENNSRVHIAYWNNDSTISTNFTIMEYYSTLISGTMNIFEFTYIPDALTATSIISNFDNYDYDSMFIINEGFFNGLDSSLNVNISYLYRNGTSASKNYYVLGIIQSLSNIYFHAKGAASNLTNLMQYIYAIPNSTPFTPNCFDIYFLQSVSPAIQATIENVLVQVISKIINNNPIEIEINHEKKSAIGKVVNNITFSAPGYLLYGPMTILSFALVILTGEKKEGIYKRLASTEVRNYELILSSIITNIILIFMQFGIGAIILSLFGWNPVMASFLDGTLGVILTIFLFSFFLLALAFALAPVFKDPDSAGGGVWIIIIPLAMVSGIFVPVELFGEFMQSMVAWLPTRFAVVALQNLLLNGQSLFYPDTMINLGLLALYSVIIFVIGIRAFNKFKN
jgi:ABC-type multidrug transport system permease subunit